MAYLPQLLTLAGVWALVVISPGPNFVATVYHATARSRRAGLLVALGIATGTILWATFSVVGLGVLFARFSWLVEVLRTVGALYLIYLGLKMIWHARSKEESEVVPVKEGSSWRAGFLTDISNPKAAAFFGSLFALFLPAHAPLSIQAASVAIVVIIAVSWYSIVACVFSLAIVARGYRRVKRVIDMVTGGILIALGIRLAIER